MIKETRRRRKVLGLISASLIIAAVSYGFAQANNPVQTTGFLGADYGVISPFQVEKIQYILDLEDPSTFTAVEIMVGEGVAELSVGVAPTKGAEVIWADTCEFDGRYWVCSFQESISVLQADWLYVSEVN